MRVIGIGFYFRTTGHGTLHCQRCGGDRPYRKCVGRRWIQLLHIPVIPLDRVGEHLQCRTCRTRYRLELLAMPTVAAMQAALPAGSRAAVTTMLRAGDRASAAARSRAIEMLRRAGLTSYDDAALSADLAAADEPGADDIEAALRTLAYQLITPAPEWFLADTVRIGLADGPLSDSERGVAELIAGHLGMSSTQAHGVILLTEESAAAG